MPGANNPIPLRVTRQATIHVVRTTIAAVASLLIARLFKLPEAYWAAITTLVVMQSSLGAALTISWQRFVGSAIGAVAGDARQPARHRDVDGGELRRQVGQDRHRQRRHHEGAPAQGLHRPARRHDVPRRRRSRHPRRIRGAHRSGSGRRGPGVAGEPQGRSHGRHGTSDARAWPRATSSPRRSSTAPTIQAIEPVEARAGARAPRR